jgi:long-chain acyl-CoA synthetase
VRLLPELADFAAHRYGNAPFLLAWSAAGWEGFTFADAARATHAFAALLEHEGVRPGDRVALLSENRPEWGIAWLAILEAGAVVVPLDALLREQEVGELLATSAATHAVASARLLPLLEQARALRAPNLRLLALDPVGGLPSFDDARRLFPDATARASSAHGDDLAVLIFTSGTTGQAKGVMLSHSNLLHNVEAVAQTFEFGPRDRFLSVLPLHHTFESTAGLLCPLRIGASVAYARSLKSNELREDLRTSRATLLLGVPLLYEKLLSALHRGIDDAPAARRLLARTLLGLTQGARRTIGVRWGRRLLRSLREASGMASVRMFVCGAACLPAEVFWGFVDFGWPVLEGYGLTECSPVVAANRPHHPRPGAVGWPLAGVDVRIDQPDADGNGEIVVRGPNVMLGYFGNPAATAEVLHDGWFSTGDLGQLTPDGRVRITGRLKNMIATAAGKKIYPEEIEIHLSNSPFILEVVVVGGKDARGEREEVHAHVFPDFQMLEALARSTGRTFDDAFVQETLQREIELRGQLLAPWKRVKRVVVHREEFPKTTTGKIRRLGDPAAAADRHASAVA